MKDSLFSKLKDMIGVGSDDAASAKKPVASEYVDWLPRYMLETSQMEVVLKSDAPLPGAQETREKLAPPGLPEQTEVINRLKVLSGLNPFPFQTPTSGSFETELLNHVLSLSLKFEDAGSASTCTVTVAKVKSADAEEGRFNL